MTETQSIEQRVAILEKQNRIFRWGICGLIICMVVMDLLPRSIKPRSIEAERLTLRDAQGTVDIGHGMITMSDSAGRTVWEVGHNNDQNQMAVYFPNGKMMALLCSVTDDHIITSWPGASTWKLNGDTLEDVTLQEALKATAAPATKK